MKETGDPVLQETEITLLHINEMTMAMDTDRLSSSFYRIEGLDT